MNPKHPNQREAIGELRELGYQVRGFAYMLGLKRLDEIPPLDEEDLSWGLGQFLDSVGRQILSLTDPIPSPAIDKASDKK